MKTSFIEAVSDISAQEFRRKYLKPQTPVVIKGLLDNTPAGKKWNMQYIKEVCGDVMVDVFDNSNENKSSAFTRPDGKMNFKEFVDNIVNDKPTTLRMFLFNMFKCKPELRKDFPCPDIFKGVLGRIGFMFFGPRGIKVRIHQDIDFSNVLLTQFYGRKKVVLVSPAYSDLLYRLPYNTYSLVDLDKPDFQKYPGLRYIEKKECILEPGDTLFMPSGYWHYITYLDGGFSVSYRKLAISFNFKKKGLLFFFIYMPVDKLMNRLLGPGWLAKKEKMAALRAAKALKKLKPEEAFDSAPLHLQPH